MREFKSFLAPHMRAFVRFRQASECWNQSYSRRLGLFDKYCAKNFPNATELTQEMVNGWCRKRDTETNNSCLGRIYVVVNFVRYMRERGLTTVSDPELPRAEKRTYIPHAFTESELHAFFCGCDALPYVPGHIDSMSRKLTVPVFFRLLYSSGLRTIEARMLHVKDADLVHGVLNIRHSKGLDQHYVVLHDSMLELMRRYDEAIERLYPDRSYFFPARHDSYHTAEWVQKNFRRIWDAVCDSKGAVSYAFRHHYAIENINSWIGLGFSFDDKLLYLQRSMGHVDPESTKGYFALTPMMYDIEEETSKESFDWIVPEVRYEESE